MKLGNVLDADEELLLRQVHPTWLVDGRPSSQAFRPTRKDEGMVSVNRVTHVTVEEAHAAHTGRGFASVGVLAITVGDCAPDIKAIEAPMTEADDGFDDSSHVILDFRGMSNGTVEKQARRLVRLAVERGFLYGPIELPTTTLELPAAGTASAANDEKAGTGAGDR